MKPLRIEKYVEDLLTKCHSNSPPFPRHEKQNMLPSQDSKSHASQIIPYITNMLYSYYNLGTDLYEYGWGQSFHFCRFAYGEPFYQAIARHEHYLAAKIGIKDGDKVLDVGCGVGGPAREIAKFTGAHITGLNNNDYQIDRATRYAAKEGLSNQLKFVKGDFMVCVSPLLLSPLLTILSKCPSLTTPSTTSTPSKPLSTPHPLKVYTAKSSVSSSQGVSLVYTNGS